MSRTAKWLVSLIALLPVFGFVWLALRGLQPNSKPAVLAVKSGPEDSSSASSLGVISSSGVPLGNLTGGDTDSSSNGANSNNPQDIAIDGSSDTNAKSSNAPPTDPTQFGQYDQYKDAKNALYGDIKTGSGDTAVSGKNITVHYTGWLTDGKMFDHNTGTTKPFGFTLGAGSVIPGWEQGVTGMKVGGERLLIVPPSVGYGANGMDPIPGNAVLVFKIQLLSVD